jgi:hypothetical protein
MNIFLKVSQYKIPYAGFSYNSAVHDFSDLKDFFVIDIDNFSDQDLVGQIIKVIADNEKTLLFIEMNPQLSTGVIPYLFRKTLKYKGKITIIWKGNHAVLEKLIAPFYKVRLDTKISNSYLNNLIKVE